MPRSTPIDPTSDAFKPSLNAGDGGGGGRLDFETPWRRLDSPQCVRGPAMLSSSGDFGELCEMFTTQKNMAMLSIVTPRDSFYRNF